MFYPYAFLRAKEFLQQVEAIRMILISGPLGSGKSLLSVALAHWFLRRGLVARASFNFPVSFASDVVPKQSFFGVDELGRLFGNRSSYKDAELTRLAEDMTVLLRKAGSYMAAPSFLDVDKKFRQGVKVWRLDRAKNRFLWFYHWEVDNSAEPADRRPGVNFWEGSFWFLHPGYFFGSYDTFFIPGNNLTREFVARAAAVRIPPPPDDVNLEAFYDS